MGGEHAVLAPSSGHRILSCPASVREEQKHNDHPKAYTTEGTLAHDLADMAMSDGVDLQDKIGKKFEVDGFTFTVTADMVDHVQGYVDFVKEMGDGADVLMGEQRVRYGPLVFTQEAKIAIYDSKGVLITVTPEEIGFGRVDAAAIFSVQRRIKIVDLKYGYTRVWAEDNEQGMLYALGILYEFGWMGDFDEIEIIIYQPRVDPDNPANSWVVSVADLHAFAARFREAAIEALHGTDPAFNPSEKACQFCKAKAHCAARRNGALEVLTGMTPAEPSDFDDVPTLMAHVTEANKDDIMWLANAMRHVGAIEDWCTDIRSEVERKLLRGEEVPGFKLVEGRMGNRKWKDAEAVEELLKKTFRLKVAEMYDLSLISPTAAEKVLKSNKARWAKVQQHIERAPGRPSVAPVEDKRPVLSLTATAEDFV